MSDKLLEVKDLCVSFDTYAGKVQAVRGVTFSLDKGEILAVVGESGKNHYALESFSPFPDRRRPSAF